MRAAILFSALLFAICVVGAGGRQIPNNPLPSTYVPAGNVMYKQYCAACHGLDAKGEGPYALMMKVPPANLTTLATRHGGKFPYEYVTGVLRFGPEISILHGAPDMPTWGPIFQYFDKNDQRAVEQRIKNLCDYLASLQEE